MRLFLRKQKLFSKKLADPIDATVFHFELSEEEEPFLERKGILLSLLVPKLLSINLYFVKNLDALPLENCIEKLAILNARVASAAFSSRLWLARLAITSAEPPKAEYFTLFRILPLYALAPTSYRAESDVESMLELSSLYKKEEGN